MKKHITGSSTYWKVDVCEETGTHFWRGASIDDMDETVFDVGEPIIMKPEHFAPGTVVNVEEPYDKKFYERLRNSQ